MKSTPGEIENRLDTSERKKKKIGELEDITTETISSEV